MNIIWNGFKTTPHTRPKNCAVCLGSFDGEFVCLPCGHGGPDSAPLHIRCVIESLNSNPGPLQSPRCPICRHPIGEKSISRLSDYVHQNKRVAFPDDRDRKKERRLCRTEKTQRKLLTLTLVGAATCEDIPDKRIYENGTMSDILKENAEFLTQVEWSLENNAYTLEDMEDKKQELEKKAEDFSVHIGRLAQMKGGGADARSEFRDIIEQTTRMRERIENLLQRVKEEEEKRQQEEERHHAHVL